jgi:hypothetical protein
MNDLTRRAREFPVEHAFRHRLRPDGRESLAHMLVMPEHGLAGFIYPTMRATGNAKGRACLFGPSLSEPVAEDVEEPVSDDLDFDRWQVGPLSMAVQRPHEQVELRWKGRDIDFEGHYEALHPPYAFSLHPRGNPPYYGDDRTEQHGRLEAVLSVDGRTLRHDGFLIRDHSWGPRIWGINQHHKWLHGVTGSCSVHLFEMQSYGRVLIHGYVFKDGVMAHVAHADYEISYDDSMMQREVRAEIVDSEDRRTSLTATTFAGIQLTWDPRVYLNEAGIEVDIDGDSGTGWVEFCWNRDYFDFAKQHVTRYGG